ncbi:MAG: hypothetical protein H7X93_01375, partial [Sphingomonadaceae bacterium]|nr:hypothetical protein [Sphingomonadaceae bacterium]
MEHGTPPWDQPLPPVDRNYDFQPTPLLHLTVPAAPGDNALGAGVRPGPPVGELVADAPH